MLSLLPSLTPCIMASIATLSFVPTVPFPFFSLSRSSHPSGFQKVLDSHGAGDYNCSSLAWDSGMPDKELKWEFWNNGYHYQEVRKMRGNICILNFCI